MLSKGHLLKGLYVNSEVPHLESSVLQGSARSPRLRGPTVHQGCGVGWRWTCQFCCVCRTPLAVMAQVPQATWLLSFMPGREQSVSGTSALDPHQCPSHQATSSPSPGNFLWSLHLPDLCPRYDLREQFVSLALSSRTPGACIIS